jgi:hypothetical protein
MAVTITERDEGKTLVVDAHDKLTRSDYERFVPQIERLIERHGKINFVARLVDLDGVEVAALWEDLKFDVKHYDDVERVAIVGDRRWMEWMAQFCKPFTTAEVEYFTPERFDEAVAWASGRAAHA